MRFLQPFLLLAFCAFTIVDFVTFSNTNIISKWLKFLAIVACFVLTLGIRERLHDLRDRWTIQIAAGITVVADFLIGILDLFLFGLGAFVLVHSLYSFRHLRGFKSWRKEMLLAVSVGALSALLLYLAAPITKAAGIFVPSLVYGVFLGTSLYAGVGVLLRDFFPPQDKKEVMKGIALFFVVDIIVALNAGLTGDAKTWTGILTWVLYLPAQYFLCMSGYRKNPEVWIDTR